MEKKGIEVGQRGTAEQVVDTNSLATSMKSGEVEVYSTPSMIALMEAAAVNAISASIKPEETSVGKLNPFPK